MNNRNIVIVVLALLVVLFFVVQHCTQDKYNWQESDFRVAYQEKEKEPYGLAAFKGLADEVFYGKVTEITKPGLIALDTNNAVGATYVFIGRMPYYDTTEVVRLLNFIKAGGTAFISARTLSDLLIDTLFSANCDYASSAYQSYDFDTVMYCTLSDAPDLKVPYAHYIRNEKVANYWSHIPERWFCKSFEWTPLGKYSNEKVNMAYFPIGAGSLYVHTTPLVFTNYQLLIQETRPYVDYMLSYIEGDRIFWDRYAKSKEAFFKAIKIPKAGKTLRNSGILATMLREPALAFSWFILLGLVGLFLVFGSKREQRLIPVIVPPKNGTLQFVRSLARLQFRQRNFKSVCKQDMLFFLNTVRERSGIHVPMQADGRVPVKEELIGRIAAATGYPQKQLAEIFTKYEPCAIYEPDADMMTDLHLAIEHFIHFKRQVGKP